jgi:uncharacterized protein YkwD
MSAERRKHDDSLPSDQWTTDPHGWNGRAATGDDWPGDAQPDQARAGRYQFDGTRSDEPWRDAGERGDSSPAGQDWPHGAAAGLPADDSPLARDGFAGRAGLLGSEGVLGGGGLLDGEGLPGSEGFSGGEGLLSGSRRPAGQRRPDDAGLIADDRAEDGWFSRPQVDQSWRYASLADDHLDAEQTGSGTPPAGPRPGTQPARHQARPSPAADWSRADDWPGTSPAHDRSRTDDWPGTASARDQPYADNWPGTASADDGPRTEPGAGRHGRPAGGQRASNGWPASSHAAETGRAAAHPDEAWRGNGHADDGPSTDRFAVDAFAADALALGPLAADPFVTDFYARNSHAEDGRISDGRPSSSHARDAGLAGPHVVGGRRASDRWLADPGAGAAGYESGRAVDGATSGYRTDGYRTDGRPSGSYPSDDRPSDGRLTDDRRTDDRLTEGDRPGSGRSGGGRGGWDDEGRPGGRRRILVSIMAAVAVILALGGYGLIRVHDGSAVALQDASSRPCAAHSARCHSRTPHAPGTSSSTAAGDPGLPGASGTATSTGSPTTRASATASTAPTHPAATTMPASTPSPTHVAAPPMRPKPTPSASASQATGTASSAAAAQVLTLINQARSEAGRPALAISSGLNTSSAQHTALMAGGCGLSHQCPGEADLGTRLTADGVQWTSAGENIGEGGPVADTSAAIAQMAVSLTQSMLNEQPPDDGHRMNILSTSFTFVGITVAIDAHGTVWMTQDFSG